MKPVNRNAARRAAFLLAACAAAANANVATAEEGSWTLSAGLDYSQGDYGSGQDTDILVAPFAVSYGAARWRLGVTVPYVRVEGAPGVVPGAAAAGGGGPLSAVTNPLLGPTGPTGATVMAPAIEEEGLGDATVELALRPTRTKAAHASRSQVRLPTGDEERSLGAGETVLSLAAGAAHPLGDTSAIYGAIGYSNATESGDDGVFASVGFETRASDAIVIGASTDWSQFTLYSGFDMRSNLRLSAYVLAGLSDYGEAAGPILSSRWRRCRREGQRSPRADSWAAAERRQCAAISYTRMLEMNGLALASFSASSRPSALMIV